MNYHTKCDHCGQVITAYTLPMNEGLAQSFLMFAEAWIRLSRPIAKHELNLTNVQYTMFQKLRHFGLIEQPHGVGRCWVLTPLGVKWYMGRAIVMTPAAWMGGKTLDEQHPAWGTHKQPRRAVTIGEVLPGGWKQRDEYCAEKAGVS